MFVFGMYAALNYLSKRMYAMGTPFRRDVVKSLIDMLALKGLEEPGLLRTLTTEFVSRYAQELRITLSEEEAFAVYNYFQPPKPAIK